MALASQVSRHDRTSGPWGSASKRQRRGPARLLAVVGLVAAVGAGAWWVWGRGGAEPAGADERLAMGGDDVTGGGMAARAGMGTQTGLGGEAGLSAPLPPDSAGPVEMGSHLDPRPPATPPVVLEMGRAPAGTAIQTPAEMQAETQGGTQAQQPVVSPDPLAAPAAVPAPEPSSPPARPATTTVDRLPSDVAAMVSAAERARAENRLVEARTLLNKALLDPRVTDRDREGLRQNIADLNGTLVFSPAAVKGDPLTDTYSVQSGDSLARITSRLGLGVDWRLVQRVNRISNPSRINVGQKLKVVRGPFHAVVDKSDFRIDLYAGEPIGAAAAAAPSRADGVEAGWIYIRSFRVGLGEFGTTPVGTFIVRPKSKLINPFWRNPRTGEEFAANDPKNPIGEHWLGLEGLDEATKQYEGYGIHGTVVPESIGKEMSMGCVRLAAEDVAMVYEMLEEGVSVVRIVP